MPLQSVKSSLIAYMEELIARADSIRGRATIESSRADNWATREESVQTYREYPEEDSKIWQYNFTSLISQVIDSTSNHWASAKRVIDAGNLEYALDEGRILLIALRDDLNRGLLDKIISQVQAEIAADYLGMAESLLGEGVRGKNEHVPAAVLAGAILERALRELCSRANPPIAVRKGNGEPKTMNPLIDELKAASVFNEIQAKLLRGWADIRNAAAHGEFERFTRNQVEQMTQGIAQFLATHS